MSGIKVFWLEPVAMIERSLRRFKSGNTCPLPFGYHSISVPIGRDVRELPPKTPDEARYERSDPDPEDFAEDPRWPTHCDCGYAFTDEDRRQVNEERLYAALPTCDLYTLHKAPVGAMWDAWWMPSMWAGPDGVCLVVRTPGGDWVVDDQASNCTRDQCVPDAEGRRIFTRSHYCWVRHGDPRTGEIHVDKNGDTCDAGAGSILVGGYHGFLHNGYLTPC